MIKNIFLLLVSLIFSTMQIQSCDICGITEIPQSPYTNGVMNPTSLKYAPNGKCLAVANYSTNTLSIFTSNPMTCELTLVGSPVPTGGIGSISVAFSRDSNCVAVVNQLSSDVSMFRIDPITCVPTLIGSPTPTGGAGPTAVTFSPTRNCLAVSNQFPGFGSISVFRLNPETCEISLIGAPVTAGLNGPVNVSYSPDGRCLAAANIAIGFPGTVSVFSVDQTTCEISLVGSPVLTGDLNPTSVSYSPNGRCLAVANSSLVNLNPGSVSIFRVNPDTCGITQIQGPVSTGGLKPISLVYSQDSRCLAVANNFSNDISIFNVASNCQVTLNGAPVPVGPFPRLESYSPDNTCFAVVNSFFNPIMEPPVIRNGSVSVFKTNFSLPPIITSVSNCPILMIRGMAQAGSIVTIFQNNVAIGTTSADANGNFIFSDPTLSPGTFSFSARATNAAGCVSLPSNSVVASLFLRDVLTNAICTKYGCNL